MCNDDVPTIKKTKQKQNEATWTGKLEKRGPKIRAVRTEKWKHRKKTKKNKEVKELKIKEYETYSGRSYKARD